MKFSYSWLCDHLETAASSAEIATTLCAIGFEVEAVEDATQALRDIVVAEVQEVAEHPQAERLHVCRVFDGAQVLQIVCGAPNVRTGLKTALVHVGGFVPKLGDTLKKAKLRGVESCGMMCSCAELNLGQEHDGIMELPESAVPGMPLAEVLGGSDPIFTVSLTPNRGDCFSVRGLARELAAAGLGRLRPLAEVQPFGALPAIDVEALSASPVSVAIETSHCPFFRNVVMKGVRNGPSPQKMQQRLKVAGQRPVDALVDVTNYLMFDRGQPSHIYDRRQIQGGLKIRSAQEGERLKLLNGQECALTSKDMVVADEGGALALAGIMGGEASGCAPETEEILFEVGYFDPVAVTLTGQALNLTSEARTRFERGVDPEGVKPCLEVGLALIQAICGGVIEGASLAQAPEREACEPQEATLSQAKLVGLSGDDSLTLSEAEAILTRLGFEALARSEDALTVRIPSWRHDVAGEADLVEEVLRMRGYDRLPVKSLPLRKAEGGVEPIREMKRILCERGLNEAYTIPFGSAEEAALFAKAGEEALEVLKPLNADKAFLQTSLVPALLKVVAFNQSRNCSYGALFEVESVFAKAGEGAHEEKQVCGVRFGHMPKHWAEASRAVDVFDAKADLLALLRFLRIDSFQVKTEGVPPYYHPGRSGVIARGREVLATFGELHPRWTKRLDVAAPVALFELRLNEGVFGKLSKADLKPFSNSLFQPVERDFAFVVEACVPARQLIETVRKTEAKIVDVQVFDVFEGASLGAGKKSLALRVTFQPLQATFTDEDLQTMSQRIIQQVKAKCGGELRE